MPDYPASEFLLDLHCHPLTQAPMVRSLTAGANRTESGLAFAFQLRGDMARLLIPLPQTGAQVDGLWEHTCFEAFICIAGDTAYREFNFSPSGQWARYDFSGYRAPAHTRLQPIAPRIDVQLTDGRLELQAFVGHECLPRSSGQHTLRIGLSAVVETRDIVDDNRSYWALKHPAERPDFHHPDGFVLELPPRDHL